MTFDIQVSVGSRGLAVAHAARRLGLQTTIVMPDTGVPVTRRDAMARQGATLHVAGDSIAAAQKEAIQLSNEMNHQLLVPHDDPLVIAGHATIALELLRQHGGVHAAGATRQASTRRSIPWLICLCLHVPRICTTCPVPFRARDRPLYIQMPYGAGCSLLLQLSKLTTTHSQGATPVIKPHYHPGRHAYDRAWSSRCRLIKPN